ncbi:hypothetical protein [Streptomyces sp. CL12-4]|uniref:hypothetical protein n=1 Tax=Streptomyces sp. CL12-4 TaxID=2810306 RepID=UPI001EFBCB0B|nr:hypothetical protein [Streptomyces sp. CL12-4]MCG8971856.1 hypothetical protein [Streptomyces sp. CL12-4]
MTISDATPHWPPYAPAPGGDGSASALLIGVEDSIDFVIDPEASPVQAMEQAGAMAALALPSMLEGAPDPIRLCADVRALLVELVDVTARHRATPMLVARMSYDGAHVTVSVGEMDRPLPVPEEEPGLYLVHGIASEVGQYAGDHGGRVTWAAVSVRT